MSNKELNKIILQVNNLLRDGKLKEADELVRYSLNKFPDEYSLLNLKAIILNYAGNVASSISLLDKIANLYPERSEVFVNKGIILLQNGEIGRAIEVFQLALKISPENSSAVYNYALALETIGNIEEAIIQYERAIEINSNNHSAFTNLGMLYLLKGNYDRGWEYYEHRFFTGELKRKELRGPRWKGEIARNKVLYVYADQGYGDVIQFSRFLREAKQRVGKLYFECQEELHELFKPMEGYDEIFASSLDFSPQANYDIQIPIMSLPLALKINEKSITVGESYLKADNFIVDKWRKYFSAYKGFKIGIVWRGNPVFKKNNIRSASLEYFIPLTKLGVKLFSLQLNTTESERELMKECGIIDVSQYLTTFAETAGAMENLNLIVSTDTSVPHLAGALGKPVWLLLAKFPDWRWGLEGNSSKWYPTMKIFRQTEQNVWEKPFKEIEKELSRIVKK